MTTALNPRMQLILHGPILRMLARLAAPNVAAVATTTAVTFADVYFIGRLGTTALASLAIVFPFQTLMGMMSNGAIGGGVVSSVARSLGGSDTRKAESAAWHAMVIGTFMSILYVVVLGLFARPVFSLIIGPGEVLDGAVDYAHIVFGGAVIVWLAFMCSAILRGTGEMAIAANAIIAASIFHIPLSGALTLGWGPFPDLGITGPATAMVVSHGLAALYLFAQVLGGKARINLRPHYFSWTPVKDIMKVGGLGLINSSGLILTVIVVTGFVGRFGDDALAGYGLGSRLEITLVPLAFGVGAALTTAVGANFGAGQIARARQIAWTGAGATLVVTSIAGILITFMPGIWLNRFTTDPEVYAIGASYLGIAAPVYGIFGGGQTLYFASQGTGHMVLPVLITYTRFLVVAGFGLAATIFDWSLTTVFVGVATGLTVIGVGQVLNVLRGPGWKYG
ncbi:MAG TPA: MATE family efflux transporter [Dehalococcoidia bacterium]|nr:multidrug transporter [Chloroflexota bacterium]MDP5876651.1 MATE family efflux transporter [Dehalococcoidia bacterium]MDP6274223.1 MATE family efflux transporter [Dehalococcoidia bacterium]MDP7213235.1 MATE family efflux transporter [Dehalococcoidia bacterium]MDP7513938.1 MATE family efflux transporter [Dehalococcoidia bacterium]